MPLEKEEEREEVGLDMDEEPELEERCPKAGARNPEAAPELRLDVCLNPADLGGGGGRGGNVDGVTVRK